MRSLRARILWGAVLWTVGLFVGTLLVGTAVMLAHPRVAIVMHGYARQHALLGIGLGAVFLAAGFLQMRRGLTSIAHLRGAPEGRYWNVVAARTRLSLSTA